MVQVFSHKVWDGRAGEIVVAAHKKTAKAIALIGGIPVASTAEDVDARFVDEQRPYIRKKDER